MSQLPNDNNNNIPPHQQGHIPLNIPMPGGWMMSVNPTSTVIRPLTHFTTPRQQMLQNCLVKFKRVLPEEKYTRLEILIKQLQTREISREDFDSKYFEIMLPYVTPPVLPQRYRDAQVIKIPPYTLSQETKKQFLNYFEISRDQKYDLLKGNPELVKILRRLVILQRQEQPSISEAGNSTVIHVQGEENIALNAIEDPVPSPTSELIGITSGIVDENNDLVGPFAKRPQTVASSSESENIDSNSANEELVKLKEMLKEMEQVQAENEKLKSDLKQAKHELQIYKHGNIDEMENMNYDQVTAVFETLCDNSNSVGKTLKRKRNEEQNDKDNMNCIICCDSRKNVIFRPCSHVVQCDSCPVPKECPVCKKKIEMACKIYI